MSRHGGAHDTDELCRWQAFGSALPQTIMHIAKVKMCIRDSHEGRDKAGSAADAGGLEHTHPCLRLDPGGDHIGDDHRQGEEGLEGKVAADHQPVSYTHLPALWTVCRSVNSPSAIPPSCPAASSSVWPLPAPSFPSPDCFCWMSLFPTWTPSSA